MNAETRPEKEPMLFNVATNRELAESLVELLDALHCALFGGEPMKQEGNPANNVEKILDDTYTKLRLAKEIATVTVNKVRGGERR